MNNMSSSQCDSKGVPTISSIYIEYLKSIKDNWSSCHAAKYLSKELIDYLEPRFPDTSTPLKVRILTSFLYVKDSLRNKCSEELCRILQLAETDPNEWVRKMSRMLVPFVSTGMVDLQETDTETAFRIINFLDEQQRSAKVKEVYYRKPGLESQHLCDPHAEIKYIATYSNIQPSEPLPVDEYKLFMARENFDTLLTSILQNGREEMQMSVQTTPTYFDKSKKTLFPPS